MVFRKVCAKVQALTFISSLRVFLAVTGSHCSIVHELPLDLLLKSLMWIPIAFCQFLYLGLIFFYLFLKVHENVLQFEVHFEYGFCFVMLGQHLANA